MFKKILFTLGILSISFPSFAQNIEGINARIDAMGGSGVIGDIGWTYGQPCAIYAFPDQIQASALIIDIEGVGKSYGSIIAIKSFFGEKFFAGLTLNDRRALSSVFYKTATEFGKFGENFDALTQLGKDLPLFPSLNFCLRPNKNLSIGLGGYLEHSRFDAKHQPFFTYSYNDNGTIKTNLTQFDSTTYKKYLGIGVNVDARIWFGSFRINPLFNMFIPKLDANVETNATDLFNRNHNVTKDTSLVDHHFTSNTTDFSKNMYMRGGIKFSGTVNKNFFILGLWYKTEKFELENVTSTDSLILVVDSTPHLETIGPNTTTSYAHERQFIDWWVGFQPSYTDNLILTTEYSGTFFMYNKTPPSWESHDSLLTRLKHKFRVGAELPLKGFWIFSEFLPRMGLTYYFTGDSWSYKNTGDVDTTSENIHWPFSSNNDIDLTDDGKGGKVTAGFGLKGKRGTFDLSFNILNWATTGITGPGAAVASLTLNIGKPKEE